MTQIPKMNPEGFEVAAKVWNDRYVDLSKSVAADHEKHAKQQERLASEIKALRACLQKVRNIALKRLADGCEDVTVEQIERCSRAVLNSEEMMPVSKALYDEWVAADDAALDWADANARWFDISTAPKEEGVSFLVTTQVKNSHRSWTETHVVHLNEDGQIHPECHQGWNLESYSHWRPIPPPPSNPPLPAPLERLGEVLRKVKEML